MMHRTWGTLHKSGPMSFVLTVSPNLTGISYQIVRFIFEFKPVFYLKVQPDLCLNWGDFQTCGDINFQNNSMRL